MKVFLHGYVMSLSLLLPFARGKTLQQQLTFSGGCITDGVLELEVAGAIKLQLASSDASATGSGSNGECSCSGGSIEETLPVTSSPPPPPPPPLKPKPNPPAQTLLTEPPTKLPTISPTPSGPPPTKSPTQSPTPREPLPLEEQDELLVCIAVIDENSNFYQQQIDSLWTDLRAKYPNRPFCLLSPEYFDGAYRPGLKLPKAFHQDTVENIHEDVVRDFGEPSITPDDWYELCKLDQSKERGVTRVVTYIDDSGSTRQGDVENSWKLFQENARNNGFEVIEPVIDMAEDFITPCLRAAAVDETLAWSDGKQKPQNNSGSSPGKKAPAKKPGKNNNPPMMNSMNNNNNNNNKKPPMMNVSNNKKPNNKNTKKNQVKG